MPAWRDRFAADVAVLATKLVGAIVIAGAREIDAALARAKTDAAARLLGELACATTPSGASSSRRRVRTAAASRRRSRTTSRATTGSVRAVSAAKVSRVRTTASAAAVTPTSVPAASIEPSTVTSPAPSAVERVAAPRADTAHVADPKPPPHLEQQQVRRPTTPSASTDSAARSARRKAMEQLVEERRVARERDAAAQAELDDQPLPVVAALPIPTSTFDF